MRPLRNPRHAARGALSILVLLLTVAGCRTGVPYDVAPAWYGGPGEVRAIPLRGDTLRIVSLNIAYAVRIDRAIALFRNDPVLRGADVLLLQEMDEPGAYGIAEALGLHYVYYAAVRHVRTGRDFGNAVLSRWPIVEHERLVLPHVARFTRTRRTATAATLDVAGRRVRVHSTHLATPVELGPGGRAAQLCAIAADAAQYLHAVIGGDFNSSYVAEAVTGLGWSWPTAEGPSTHLAGRLDHIVLKGLSWTPGRAGTVDSRGASDHRAVWLDVVPDGSARQ